MNKPCYFNGKNEHKHKNSHRLVLLVLMMAVCLMAAGCAAGQQEAGGAAGQEGAASVSLNDIPEYTGRPYIEINENQPYFDESDLTETTFETYSDLDSLGRCGAAYACVGKEVMPTEERGSIGMVKPAGWHTVKYQNVDGKYLYNRCHLIGYQLTAENANEKNLITGTRYLNMEGMLPFENEVANYVKETNHHVLYRVTPLYDGDNLLAGGVLMEALSVEDQGKGVKFNVYAYNVQPDIAIDYRSGDSHMEGQTETKRETSAAAAEAAEAYIVNRNSDIFHKPDCPSVKKMAEKNKEPFKGKRSVLIDQGLKPCGNCHP